MTTRRTPSADPAVRPWAEHEERAAAARGRIGERQPQPHAKGFDPAVLAARLDHRRKARGKA
jgi:hypothetical protein